MYDIESERSVKDARWRIFTGEHINSDGDVTAHYYKNPFPLFLITSSFLIVLSAAFTLIVVYVNYRWYVELINSRKALLSSLSSLAEGRDIETGRHLERTKKYGNVLARRLAKNPKYAGVITDDLIEDYLDAFPLHDIGKVGIRDSILLKPGKLTQEEFEEIKRHSTIGKHVLQNAIERYKLTDPLFHLAKNVCAYHHEKFNGKGYPEGLRDRAIPLEARIFALCDVYDAVRSKRCYKEEVAHEKVAGMIVAERGEHFDPDVVDAFLDVQDEFQEIHDSYKYLVDYYGQVFMAESVSKDGLRWTAELEVGIEIIDTQHKKLFKMINDFIKAVGEGKGRVEIGRTLQFLKEYVNTHFSMEEGYMRKFNYPEYELHLKQHADFMELVRNMTDGVGDTGEVSVLIREVERAVGEWLVNHIIVVDKNLGKFLADKLK